MAGHGAGVTFFRSPGLFVTMWSQTCILLQTFGEAIRVEDISMLYEEERLPEWWLKDTSSGKKKMTFAGLLGDIGGVFWRHLYVKVPAAELKNPLKGW
ncbi:hypothetical protein LTR36_009202 [Oleoguttula mirabilis]|uniref:Uncharacterized protein n=1 Tax=Oleoguttula mirabilis TaxID=1507867 RepID=A0AAV9J6X5_9PEZI|nr:hypothetical protein LTR36_009202 [Oleoguttula mirabilis]